MAGDDLPRVSEAGGLFALVVCHLDDSGEKREPVVTLAGYLATAEEYYENALEQKVRAIFYNPADFL
jgi:hypothetical protein